ncbi:MAG TPA: D-2-hydroxyacid dehydrogenase, partial [Bacillota bacterium]|nr:D-2-hydroxyacid dehydrogenase [Bacillota bacterium]
MIVVFSIKLNEKHQQQLNRTFPEVTFFFRDSMDEAMENIEKADVLVSFGGQVTEAAIKQATDLKWLMVMTAGVDVLPKDLIIRKNILVTNARGIHKTPMAEYAISMLLQVMRNEKTLFKNESEHKWDPVYVDEISGKTLLVAGTGAIGSEVARLGKAFNMKTIGVSRSGRHVEYFDENVSSASLSSKLPEADFVVSVMPSTPETIRYFTYGHFRQMPNHSVFLNMGRGDALDLDELVQAVKEKEIAHAVLDVFD